MSHETDTVEFHIDPHTRDKSITASRYDEANNVVTVKEKDVRYFSVYSGTHEDRNYRTGRSTTEPYGRVTFYFDRLHSLEVQCAPADVPKIKGFFIGKAVEVDANGAVITTHTDDETTTDDTHTHETPDTSEDITQIKKDVNTLGLSIATIFGRLEELAPTVYGSFRLEVVAATDNTPMYADLFGLDVVDANPANEATDTIVCSINMLGADMCQHKMNPNDPEDNQWVIEVLSANGLKHRFHTHSAGDFGLIFDAVRAGTTAKVYSTRPTPAPAPSPTG